MAGPSLKALLKQLPANLWLRTADRIKIVVGEFNAYSFDELFEKLKHFLGKIICL